MGQGSSITMSCGIGHRCSLDSVWLWLWYRPAAMIAIQALAWELPYAAGAALKSKRIKRHREFGLFLVPHFPFPLPPSRSTESSSLESTDAAQGVRCSARGFISPTVRKPGGWNSMLPGETDLGGLLDLKPQVTPRGMIRLT